MIQWIKDYWLILFPAVPKSVLTQVEVRSLLLNAMEAEEEKNKELHKKIEELEAALAKKTDIGPLKFVRSAWPESTHGVTVYFTDRCAAGHFLSVCNHLGHLTEKLQREG